MIKFATLIIFCSLASLSIAGEKKKIPECGPIYKCFVPDSCTTDDDSRKIFVGGQSVVEEVTTNIEVYDNCAAIIRIHSYTEYWAHVSIESRSDASSIIFHQKFASEFFDVVAIECKKESNNEVKGRYISRNNYQQGIELEMIESNPSPLKCVFEVKLKSDQNVIDANGNAKTQIEIDSFGKSMEADLNVEKLRCDPRTLNYDSLDIFKSNENYQKVVYSPERLECKDKNLYTRMEYRLENEKSYKIMTRISCQAGQFVLTEQGEAPNAITVPKGDFIYIRCVADAQYVCDYHVNTIKMPSADPNFAALEQTMPKPTTQPGEIKCPSSHKFMELKRKAINGEIKCKNHGEYTQWTIGDLPLRENGDEVRCAKELRCHEKKKLPASSIKKGSLINYVPTCHDKGTMKLVGGGDEVSKVYCNSDTGNFEYTIGDKKHLAENANFVCEYPLKEIDHKKIDEEKKGAFKTGGVVTGVVVGIVVLVFLLLLVAIPNLRMYLLKKRTLKKDQEEWESVFGKKEKAKMNKELQEKKVVKKEKITTDTSDINPFHLTTRQLARNVASPDDNDNVEKYPSYVPYQNERYENEVVERRPMLKGIDETLTIDKMNDFMKDTQHFVNTYPKKAKKSKGKSSSTSSK